MVYSTWHTTYSFTILKTYTMGKRGLPDITDRFTEKTIRGIKWWALEGKINKEKIVSIGNGYRINTNGQVIGKNNAPLKHIFRKWKRSPFVIMAVSTKDNSWTIVSKTKEERIDTLMEKYFWPYIAWYWATKLHKNTTYIIVPKDGNWDDMSINNLEYTTQEEYNLNWTKKALLIELIPFLNNKSDEELAKLLSTTRWWISRVKTELKEKWRIGDEILNTLVISHKTYQIYVALLSCNWLKSNLDIAKELRANANFTDKEEQERLTNKVSRVRRKLYDRWLIKKYNTYQKDINIEDVRHDLEKALIANNAMEKWKRKTHAEIATLFGLEKQQVDNYSRQIAKKKKEKIEE